MMAGDMLIPLKTILRTALRWGAVWAVVGLASGIALMFVKAEFMAESGAKPLGMGEHAFWIPVMLGVTIVFGLALGLIYACLMAAVQAWWIPAQANAGPLATYGPRLLCGTVAGGAIGLMLARDSTVLTFASLGLMSAVVSCTVHVIGIRRQKVAAGGQRQTSHC
jgi:hypothetical protein